MKNRPCPVCLNEPVSPEPTAGHRQRFVCGHCGTFECTIQAESYLDDRQSNEFEIARLSLSHWLRDQQRYRDLVVLDRDKIDQLILLPQFPDMHTQIENFIRHVGDEAKAAGAAVNLTYSKLQPIIGARTSQTVREIGRYLIDEGTIQNGDNTSAQTLHGYLTIPGWLKYEELLSGTVSGRSAFMAMPFGHKDLDDNWYKPLKAAISETGFDLKRVDEEPKPDIIDLQMQEKIRAARFLVVELTHDNSGAYWEAGYAHGMGKPVFYTCKNGHKPHFDVEHWFRIDWDPNDIETALNTAKSAVRLNIPDAWPAGEA